MSATASVDHSADPEGGRSPAGSAAPDVMAVDWYTVRGLGRAPGHTAIVILTLAVGIDASSAMFGVIHAILVRPRPFRARNEWSAGSRWWGGVRRERAVDRSAIVRFAVLAKVSLDE
jgi:hypothetical protein